SRSPYRSVACPVPFPSVTMSIVLLLSAATGWAGQERTPNGSSYHNLPCRASARWCSNQGGDMLCHTLLYLPIALSVSQAEKRLTYADHTEPRPSKNQRVSAHRRSAARRLPPPRFLDGAD